MISDSPIDSLIKKNLKMAVSTSDSARVPLSNAYPKAMRYLLQKFGESFNASLKRQDRDSDLKKSKRIEDEDSCKERLIERLRYLGLAPRKYGVIERSSSSKRKRHPPKKLPQALAEDDEFVRPQVLECDYCSKIFFNKTLHRSHTINHLKIRRCTNCDQPFKDKISHRRHQVNCKQKIYYQIYARKIFES